MSAPGREPPVPRKLGFWMCLALVVGNVVGSGVYLLPASLAPLGRSVFAGWLVTAVGALALGVVFAALSRELRGNGGPYAATRAAFGPLAGFVVAWGYWVSIWVGNVTIATGAVSYTSALVPWIASVPGAAAVVTVAVVWLLTFVNCFGVRAVGWVQAVTTVLKSLPLVVVPLAVLLRLRPEWLTTLAAAPAITLDGTSAAATLALWAVVGFESGNRAGRQGRGPRAHHPALDARRHADQHAALRARVQCGDARGPERPARGLERTVRGRRARALRRGRGGGRGGARGRERLRGAQRLDPAAGRAALPDGEGRRLPAGVRQELAARRARLRARLDQPADHALVLANSGRSLVDVFTFMALLSTTANLVAYLACSLALLALVRRREIRQRAGAYAAVALLGAGYSLWAIAGAGWTTILWGAVLILVALPVYWLMRRSPLRQPEPAEP